jgi:hypothetical protein
VRGTSISTKIILLANVLLLDPGIISCDQQINPFTPHNLKEHLLPAITLKLDLSGAKITAPPVFLELRTSVVSLASLSKLLFLEESISDRGAPCATIAKRIAPRTVVGFMVDDSDFLRGIYDRPNYNNLGNDSSDDGGINEGKDKTKE